MMTNPNAAPHCVDVDCSVNDGSILIPTELVPGDLVEKAISPTYWLADSSGRACYRIREVDLLEWLYNIGSTMLYASDKTPQGFEAFLVLRTWEKLFTYFLDEKNHLYSSV
jgi:hypothetical protein